VTTPLAVVVPMVAPRAILLAVNEIALAADTLRSSVRVAPVDVIDTEPDVEVMSAEELVVMFPDPETRMLPEAWRELVSVVAAAALVSTPPVADIGPCTTTLAPELVSLREVAVLELFIVCEPDTRTFAADVTVTGDANLFEVPSSTRRSDVIEIAAVVELKSAYAT
jgi:hypothetical protein